MCKCPNCGAEVEAGMKFCGECGTKMPELKKCPKCGEEMPMSSSFCGECGFDFNSAAGLSRPIIGDKNVIAGDINVSNTTNVRNTYFTTDETKHVVECVVCGRSVVVTEAYRCGKCKEYVCKDHYDIEHKRCHVCREKEIAEIESKYEAELSVVLEDGVVDQEEHKRLEALRKELGISEERALKLQKRMQLARRQQTARYENLTSVESSICEQARVALYGEADPDKALKLVGPVFEKHRLNPEALGVYVDALTTTDEQSARKLIASYPVDAAELYLAEIDLDLCKEDYISADRKLMDAVDLWPNDFQVQCRRIEYQCVTYMRDGNRANIIEAGRLLQALGSAKNKLNKVQGSWGFYVAHLYSQLSGNAVRDIIRGFSEYDASLMYLALSYGRLRGRILIKEPRKEEKRSGPKKSGVELADEIACQSSMKTDLCITSKVSFILRGKGVAIGLERFENEKEITPKYAHIGNYKKRVKGVDVQTAILEIDAHNSQGQHQKLELAFCDAVGKFTVLKHGPAFQRESAMNAPFLHSYCEHDVRFSGELEIQGDFDLHLLEAETVEDSYLKDAAPRHEIVCKLNYKKERVYLKSDVDLEELQAQTYLEKRFKVVPYEVEDIGPCAFEFHFGPKGTTIGARTMMPSEIDDIDVQWFREDVTLSPDENIVAPLMEGNVLTVMQKSKKGVATYEYQLTDPAIPKKRIGVALGEQHQCKGGTACLCLKMDYKQEFKQLRDAVKADGRFDPAKLKIYYATCLGPNNETQTIVAKYEYDGWEDLIVGVGDPEMPMKGVVWAESNGHTRVIDTFVVNGENVQSVDDQSEPFRQNDVVQETTETNVQPNEPNTTADPEATSYSDSERHEQASERWGKFQSFVLSLLPSAIAGYGIYMLYMAGDLFHAISLGAPLVIAMIMYWCGAVHYTSLYLLYTVLVGVASGYGYQYHNWDYAAIVGCVGLGALIQNCIWHRHVFHSVALYLTALAAGGLYLYGRWGIGTAVVIGICFLIGLLKEMKNSWTWWRWALYVLATAGGIVACFCNHEFWGIAVILCAGGAVAEK